MENVREMGYRGVYENGLLSHKKHEDIWPAAEMYFMDLQFQISLLECLDLN